MIITYSLLIDSLLYLSLNYSFNFSFQLLWLNRVLNLDFLLLDLLSLMLDDVCQFLYFFVRCQQLERHIFTSLSPDPLQVVNLKWCVLSLFVPLGLCKSTLSSLW